MDVPDSVGAVNGLSFPVVLGPRMLATEFYWLGSPVDDVVVEGCNDGAIRVSRDSSQAMKPTPCTSDSGSAELGLDYLVSLEEIVMGPGVLDTLVLLQVADDGVLEGAEDVLISRLCEQLWGHGVVECAPCHFGPHSNERECQGFGLRRKRIHSGGWI